MTYAWIALFVLFFILEGITYSMISIWFAVGSIASFVVSFFTDSVSVQLIVFLVISVITLILFRGPLNKKLTNNHSEKTNFNQVVGKVGIVTERIDNLHATGRASISGMSWMARSEDDAVCIEKDEKVVVQRTEGVKIYVQKLEES